MTPDDAYGWLRDHSVETAYMVSTAEVLAWDQRTSMPPKGQAHRCEQMAAMAKLLHERATDRRIGDRLAAVEGSDLLADPVSPAAVNVREWRRDYDRSTRIPQRLAVELARATAGGEARWEAARPGNDWAGFAPALGTIVELLREKAEAMGYRDEAYDALIDDYEPGETAASVEAVLGSLRGPLVELVRRIGGSDRRPRRSILEGSFPVERQRRLITTVVSSIGYDLEAGRIDVAAHPFTVGIGPGDVRITNRYSGRLFSPAFYGALHEAGHGLYEQGLPAAHWGTPRGQVASLGVHESQSRLWENMVGRSRGFWEHFFPLARRRLRGFGAVDLDTLWFAVNAVEPSLIRVEADEVTYNLHILLRFELELALLRRELAVAELPEAWNAKTREYLGIEPPDVAGGVMQDVHWSAGLIGYFPTYTLGNIYAAQLFRRADEELGDLQGRFAKGDFASLLGWLRERVHEPGGTHRPRELLARVTGRALDAGCFLDYCEEKYGRLYGLQG